MKISDFSIEKLYDCSHSLAGVYLRLFRYPWLAIPHISTFVELLSARLNDDFSEIKRGIFVHKTAQIAPSASIAAPCIIGANAQVRHCAFVRGNAIIGENAVVGNSVELKNCILFDGVQVPHFNYVGDSILGYKAHLGAGAITSNVKGDRSLVTVRMGEKRFETGLYKCGAFLGDGVEVGCNAVLNPGTVVGRNTRIYPLVSARGAYPANTIVKK